MRKLFLIGICHHRKMHGNTENLVIPNGNTEFPKFLYLENSGIPNSRKTPIPKLQYSRKKKNREWPLPKWHWVNSSVIEVFYWENDKCEINQFLSVVQTANNFILADHFICGILQYFAEERRQNTISHRLISGRCEIMCVSTFKISHARLIEKLPLFQVCGSIK